MKLSKSTTILLIILGVVSIGAAVVIMNALSGGPSDEAILSEVEGAGNVDEALFMNLASQINDIKFDESLFKDPRFMSLVDIRVLVVPESVGRKDPFANLPGIAPAQ